MPRKIFQENPLQNPRNLCNKTPDTFMQRGRTKTFDLNLAQIHRSPGSQQGPTGKPSENPVKLRRTLQSHTESSKHKRPNLRAALRSKFSKLPDFAWKILKVSDLGWKWLVGCPSLPNFAWVRSAQVYCKGSLCACRLDLLRDRVMKRQDCLKTAQVWLANVCCKPIWTGQVIFLTEINSQLQISDSACQEPRT